MTTGLFANRGTHQGRAFSRHKAVVARQKLDDFAEMLAEEVHPEVAASRLGYAHKYGARLLAKIRAGLGAQAV